MLKKSLPSASVIFLITAFWMAFANFSFYGALLKSYPIANNLGFVASVIISFSGVLVIVLALLCHRYTMKPLLTVLLISSSFAAYFMDSYQVLIDTAMIQNTLSTNVSEASDLMSLRLLVYVLLLGVLPSAILWRTSITFRPLGAELIVRLKIIVTALLVMAVLFFLSSAGFSSFFREHKAIRYYFNPANYVFALGKHIKSSLYSETLTLTAMGGDATILETNPHRELIIVVVGETARADRFSLNGYARETNPELKRHNPISFTDFQSCGTSTAVSVPCMFSSYGQDDFETDRGNATENALDVLTHAGVNVLWRDNNSSSKGVADRVNYQDYRTPKNNPICDDECRDEGMLVGLQDYIDADPSGDIVIVLHQMGNHGPAYYKRYPKEFEKFTPVCATNELSDCSKEEINNAYDNAILYTDYFLAKTIDFLKTNDDQFETALLYVSDHGESLGENGLYLHGMPNFVAPKSQRHVPVIMWIGKNFDEISYEDLAAKRHRHFTHDNIFHTLLNMVELESSVLDPSLSLLSEASGQKN